MCVIPTNLTMIEVPTSHRNHLTMLVVPTSHRLRLSMPVIPTIHRFRLSMVVVVEVAVGMMVVVVVECLLRVHCACSLPGFQGVRHFHFLIVRERRGSVTHWMMVRE